MNKKAVAVLAAIVLIGALTAWRLRGPEPKPATAPANQFSAARALQAERDTIGGTIPHPSGSPANQAVRDRIVARMQSYGYAVRTEKRFACSAHPLCAEVENIIATRPGDKAGRPVILTVHYDSVPAGPGASDDGIGVASALEIARIVRTERFANPIEFLIDDGEELGLLGAEAFVAGRPEVGAVVNLEARGTSGPSYLFETGSNNRGYLPQVARALPMPITTSLFASIYDRLPNDTDLTVFKREGLAGVNFAPVGNVHAYHTPNDNIDHVDLRTLQHKGDNALAALRTLGNLDLRHRRPGNAVWFDLLGFFVITWPESWTIVFAVVAWLIAILGATLREGRRETLIGVALFIASIVLAALIGIAIGLGQPAFIARPLPLIAAAALAGFLVATLRRGIGGIAVGWNLLAVVVALLLPGASYLFIVPGLILGIALFTTDLVAPLVAALLWTPLALVIYDALGRNGLVVVAVAAALIGSTVPMRSMRFRRAPWGGGSLAAAAQERGSGAAIPMTTLAVIVILVMIGRLLPAYTATKPQRINVDYYDDGSPHWLATAMNSTLHNAAPFAPSKENLAPWSPYRWSPFLAPAPKLAVPPVVVTREGTVIHVRSQRNADRVTLSIEGTVPSLRVNGIVPPPRPKRFTSYAKGWTRVVVRAASMDVDVGTTAPLKLIATDTTFGAPFEASPLIRARNVSNAIRSDDGDVTITQRSQ